MFGACWNDRWNLLMRIFSVRYSTTTQQFFLYIVSHHLYMTVHRLNWEMRRANHRIINILWLSIECMFFMFAQTMYINRARKTSNNPYSKLNGINGKKSCKLCAWPLTHRTNDASITLSVSDGKQTTTTKNSFCFCLRMKEVSLLCATHALIPTLLHPTMKLFHNMVIIAIRTWGDIGRLTHTYASHIQN